MVLQYFIQNFMPLMIILAILAMMYVNRDVKIPAANLFLVVIGALIVLTLISTFNSLTDINGAAPEKVALIVRLHTITSALSYILRPCLIMLEILIVLNDSRFRILYSIPAVINGIIFATALFGGRIAFFTDDNNYWHAGPLHNSIFITQFFYLILLLFTSIISFKEKSRRKSIVLIAMVVQAVLVALLESNGVEPSYTDSITALCILEYYIYLSTVYRQELTDRLDDYVEEVESAGLRLQALTRDVITAFANSIDAKDKYTHGHSSRVAEYARILAKMNGKGDEECDEIYYAGLLHDIGKIGVPESIITKEGKLTSEEYEMIKQHPVLGAQILGSITEFPYLGVGARSHHERYDGKGYPDGLKGADIPEYARIIAVADAYDAMSSKRSYRDPIPQQKVREELVKGTGTQFDPEYARIMLHLIDEDLEYSMSEREESSEFDGSCELIVNEYRSSVSDGVLITPCMTTISFSIMSSEESSGAYPVPSIILFDSLDARVHNDPKEIKDLNYYEYGEIDFDYQAITIGARKIRVETKEEGSPDIRHQGDFRIEAVRVKDHALVRILGKEKTGEIVVALPDNSRFLYLGLSGEHVHYRNIKTVKDETETPADRIPRIAEEISYINVPAGDIPNVQIDGYRTAHSKGIPIKDGLKVTFHAQCLPTARLVWHCPFIDIFISDSGLVEDDTYSDLAFSRFDGECWQCDENVSVGLNVTTTGDFDGWDTWKEFNKEGYDTEVRFAVEGNRITIRTENAGILVDNTVIIYNTDKTVYAALTGDQVALTNIRISYSGQAEAPV